MKGIVFNVLEQLVSREYGEGTWDALLDGAGVEGAYTSLGNYPYEDLEALVGAASRALDITPDEVVRWFGRNALPVFAQRSPQLFAPHPSARTFVLTLNDIIHPKLRKLVPRAEVPVFDFAFRDEILVMGQRSPRRLCAFAEVISIEQPACMKRGDDRCLFEIAFGG